MTNQPKWKQIGTVGDINFVQYDGGPVFIDETGVYPPELEYVQRMPEPDTDAYVYRIILEDLKLSSTGHLITKRYDASFPFSEDSYVEWFDKDLDGVASYCGQSREDLITALTSDNPMARAFAYMELAAYHGWENFDSDPLHFKDESELEKRYETHPYVGKVS